MSNSRPVLVNLAPTGVVPTKRDNPFVPITADEIAADVLSCAKIGITSVHLHARDPEGRQTHKGTAYAKIIERIRAATPEVVLCVTCSGRTVSEFSARSEVLDLTGDVRPDMASLTLGSMMAPRTDTRNEAMQALMDFSHRRPYIGGWRAARCVRRPFSLGPMRF